MAKVDGPIFSVEARGKLADAVVYFPWKGRHIVRQWLKPTQPRSIKQGFVRVALYTIGKAISKILATAKGSAVDSELYKEATSSVPSGLNWNAWLCGGFVDRMGSAGSLVTGSFESVVDEYSSLGTDELSSWAIEGSALGLSDFAFSYGYTANIPAGLQLYAGAIAAYERSLGSFTTEPVSMGTEEIGAFADAFTEA